MNDHERKLFNGKCPYSDLPCDKDIECFNCSVEEYERRLYEGESEEQTDGNDIQSMSYYC